ncbi:glycosyltransferase family A protein [Pukyongiella litopenaei]|uniref:Glycosyltransferase family 2 protein n=1 Tax=Pukyongiella litopenaei TaxID=2605946 RepID=A0A2S0MRF2_9RHOB|nr:glycosyltransferase family A protein [Pukyongiella litopenaei]AVO38460.2 glycosyltransferase family 2 protein [Pukyongiella litopenaei]
MSETHSFSVRPGETYQLRIRLCAGDGMPHDWVTEIGLLFLSADDRKVTADLFCQTRSLPHADPCRVETLPAPAGSDRQRNAGTASRYLVAPPDADRLEITLPEGVVAEVLELAPLDLFWPREAGQLIASLQKTAAERWQDFASEYGASADHPARTLLRDVPVEQARVLARWHSATGDWDAVLAELEGSADADDYDLRMARLRAANGATARVGFIGSARLRERLDGFCHVVWLRETCCDTQIAMLDLDLILIETVNDSAPGDWSLAFSSLTGALPEAGKRLFELADTAGIDTRMVVTTSPSAVHMWREALDRTSAVTVEGARDWSGLPRTPVVVPRSTDPTACSPFSLQGRNWDRVLVPAGSDLFQFPDFADFFDKAGDDTCLIAEFRYQFVPRSLQVRMPSRQLAMASDLSRHQQRMLMQHAGIVIIPGTSLRTMGELEELALDAIASGAIPVMFGDPPGESTILNALDRIFAPVDLMRLRLTFRALWLRERRWLALYRDVMRHHVWTADHASAILGDAAASAVPQRPLRGTAVVPTKRIWLLPDILATFRRQTWPDRELIVVMNTDEAIDLPDLHENEHVYFLSESANIGECLNRAIAAATGYFWAKMDDDDFYSSFYLEDLAYYYRASQADVCGRLSPIFYFEEPDETAFAQHRSCPSFFVPQDHFHVSGACLSAIRNGRIPAFSPVARNAADTDWQDRVCTSNARYVCANTSSIVVFRSKDDSRHTWKVSRQLRGRFQPLYSGADNSMLDCLPDPGSYRPSERGPQQNAPAMDQSGMKSQSCATGTIK